jgi:hypothetical protein
MRRGAVTVAASRRRHCVRSDEGGRAGGRGRADGPILCTATSCRPTSSQARRCPSPVARLTSSSCRTRRSSAGSRRRPASRPRSSTSTSPVASGSRAARPVAAGRVRIRKAEYWGGDGAQANLRRRYVREVDRSAIVLAPAGYGYLTFRHADAWARGRVALSEPVHRRVQVPERWRWEAGEVCLTYDPAADDIVEVVERALEDPARLAAIAASGRH